MDMSDPRVGRGSLALLGFGRCHPPIQSIVPYLPNHSSCLSTQGNSHEAALSTCPPQMPPILEHITAGEGSFVHLACSSSGEINLSMWLYVT